MKKQNEVIIIMKVINVVFCCSDNACYQYFMILKITISWKIVKNRWERKWNLVFSTTMVIIMVSPVAFLTSMYVRFKKT